MAYLKRNCILIPLLQFLPAPLHALASPSTLIQPVSRSLLTLFVLIILGLITYVCALFRERKRYAGLLDKSTETILICDPGGRIRENVSNSQPVDRLQDLFNNDWEIEQALGTICALGHGKESRLDITCQRESGDTFYQLIFQNMLHRREIRGICVNIREITEFKILERRLIKARQAAYREARHDPLTSVPNRLYFSESIEHHFARLKRRPRDSMCLLMLDLDHFKNINDSHGHDVGDQVLKQLTRICGDIIRSSDTFARYGGEEFVCILDDLKLDAASDVCERMRQTIEDYGKWPEGITLTVSIGLVEYAGETDPEELIKKADIAMYRAKATGRNRVCLF